MRDIADANIRPARPSDTAALTACIDAAYAIYQGRIADLPDVSGAILQDIENNIVLVAEDKERLLGGMILVPAESHLHLANIVVDPAIKGRGVGRILLQRAEQECRRRGLPELRLATHINMPDNVALYVHLGWHQTGVEGNKVLMAKNLSE